MKIMSIFRNLLLSQNYFLKLFFYWYLLRICYNASGKEVNLYETTLIGIAGGTASGKTTVLKVFNEANKFGSVVVVRLDDYIKKCLI